MAYSEEKVDEAVLGLLALFAFEENRSWKGFDWGAMGRLHERGLIQNPVNTDKSVYLTEEGLQHGRQAAARLFDATWGQRK